MRLELPNDPQDEAAGPPKEGGERPRIVGITSDPLPDRESGLAAEDNQTQSAASTEPKPRKVTTADERALRNDEKTRAALDRALAEQDALDARCAKAFGCTARRS